MNFKVNKEVLADYISTMEKIYESNRWMKTILTQKDGKFYLKCCNLKDFYHYGYYFEFDAECEIPNNKAVEFDTKYFVDTLKYMSGDIVFETTENDTVLYVRNGEVNIKVPFTDNYDGFIKKENSFHILKEHDFEYIDTPKFTKALTDVFKVLTETGNAQTTEVVSVEKDDKKVKLCALEGHAMLTEFIPDKKLYMAVPDSYPVYIPTDIKEPLLKFLKEHKKHNVGICFDQDGILLSYENFLFDTKEVVFFKSRHEFVNYTNIIPDIYQKFLNPDCCEVSFDYNEICSILKDRPKKSENVVSLMLDMRDGACKYWFGKKDAEVHEFKRADGNLHYLMCVPLSSLEHVKTFFKSGMLDITFTHQEGPALCVQKGQENSPELVFMPMKTAHYYNKEE